MRQPKLPTKDPTPFDDIKITEMSEVPVPAPAALPVQVVQRPPRRVGFEQWARARGIKQSHKGGLLAYVQNPSAPRSYEDWDKVFANY